MNAICPGVVDTPMPRKYLENVEDKEAAWKVMESMHLLKRLATPEKSWRPHCSSRRTKLRSLLGR